MNIATAENEVCEDNVENILEAESDADQPGLTELEREHYERIKDLNCRVHEAAYVHDIAKSKAKAAKESLESLQLELSCLITDGPRVPDPQQTLPFEDAEADDWKRTDIQVVLKLTEKQREKLEAAGIVTLGEFEHVRSCQHPDYPNGLQSIKGIGEKTIDAMENDVVEWMSKNVREMEPSAA